jgi:hypothetical protein
VNQPKRKKVPAGLEPAAKWLTATRSAIELRQFFGKDGIRTHVHKTCNRFSKPAL